MNRKRNIAITSKTAFAVLVGICFLVIPATLHAQRITNTGPTITVQPGSKVYFGTYVHQDGMIDNSGELHLTDSIVNNLSTFGIFGDDLNHPAAGRVLFRGTGAQQVSGSGMIVFFYNVTLDNASAVPLTLYKALNVENELLFTTGNINLNARIIDLGPNGHLQNEADNRRIFGTQGHVLVTRNLTNFTGEISNFGLYIDAASNNFGLTEIRRAHYQLSPFSSSGHVNRFYDFRPANPDGSIVSRVGLEFFNSEKLPAHNIADYKVFHSYTDGFSWVKETSVANDDPQFDFQAMAMDVKNFGGNSPALQRSLVTLSEGTCANPPVVELGAPTRDLCEDASLQLTGPSGQQAYIWSKDGVVIPTATTRQLSVTEAGFYELHVIDANGCDGFDHVTVDLKEKPVANFSVNNFACVGDATSFSDLSTSADGTITYQWNFGDPSSSTDVSTTASPSYTYTNSGGFNATLVVTSSFGCVSDVANKPAVVNALPTVNFTADEVCFGSITTLTNTSTAGTTSSWDLGNGVTSTDRNPQHAFSFVNVNSVTLLVTDPNTTCSQSITKDVLVNPVPIADFTAIPSCDPNEVDFDNTSVISSGSITYDWSFGDGEVSVSQDASKTYLQAGTFTVLLEATSDKGCTSTKTENVTVSMPQPVFGNNATTCGSQLVLDANESGRYPGATYRWSDNSTNQTFTARSSGVYTVTIRMPNACETTGSVRVTLNSVIAPSLGNAVEGCGSYTIDAGFYPAGSYEWSTGATSQAITVSQSGTYAVDVTDQNGCVGSSSVNVTINPIPLVDLGADRTLCNGETTRFDAGTSGTTYLWSDGSTNQFLTAGSNALYNVIVTNGDGCSATDEARVTILPAVAVDLGPDKLICAGAPVTLEAKVNNVTYSWASSNGTTGTSRTLETNRPGSYWVTITTLSGCTAADTIEVNETANTLKAEFLSASEVEPGDTLQFINVSYPRPFDSSWNFGNGQLSTVEDAQVIYYQEGIYNVRLDITNQVCSNYRVKPITVKRETSSGGRGNNAPQDDIISVKAFPNPTTGTLQVTIELSSNMSVAVAIVNTIGVPLFNEKSETEFIDRSFDLHNLTPGVYFVKVITPRQSKFVRILKL